MNIEGLRSEYQAELANLTRLREALVDEVARLLQNNGVTLGVPIESRVKSWSSLEDKLDRKALNVNSVSELDDLVGVRVILLFHKDLPVVGSLLKRTFDVLRFEDTGRRLTETQFGYQSQHYILRLPGNWSRVPTFSDLVGRKAEIQVRTLAQHMWAAASHTLQYKHENSVPPPLRRTIHRVSALLETVDLELDRVLEERRGYVDEGIRATNPDEPLNVDLVASVLSELLPPENKDDMEPYAELLEDLLHLGVNTADQLRGLILRNKHAMLRDEESQLAERIREDQYQGTSKERTERGVFFTHVGLARVALMKEALMKKNR